MSGAELQIRDVEHFEERGAENPREYKRKKERGFTRRDQRDQLQRSTRGRFRGATRFQHVRGSTAPASSWILRSFCSLTRLVVSISILRFRRSQLDFGWFFREIVRVGIRPRRVEESRDLGAIGRRSLR
jgi:hypothetical protein